MKNSLADYFKKMTNINIQEKRRPASAIVSKYTPKHIPTEPMSVHQSKSFYHSSIGSNHKSKPTHRNYSVNDHYN